MTSDGFSVKTTISQIANLARTQVKGQATQPVNPATDKLLKNDKRVDRVKHNEEVQKQKIDPDRKRDRGGTANKEPQDEVQDTPSGAKETAGSADEPEDGGKGVMLDTKA